MTRQGFKDLFRFSEQQIWLSGNMIQNKKRMINMTNMSTVREISYYTSFRPVKVTFAWIIDNPKLLCFISMHLYIDRVQ